MEKGADCNAQDACGLTPFAHALEMRRLDWVKLLLDHGADIAAVSSLGMTALHHASVNFVANVLEFVLNWEFDINARDSNNNSALIRAVLRTNLKACEILLKRGAIVNQRGSRGLLPLDFALGVQFKYGAEMIMVEVLLKYGAKVTRGHLTAAASGRNSGIKKALMRHMAKLEFLNAGIEEDHRRLIENEDCYREYYRACVRERERMVATKFYDNVSVFDILTNSDQVLSGYARNEELVAVLKEKDPDHEFPIYFAGLKKRFYTEVKRQRLRMAAAKILCHLFALNDPLHLVTQQILFHLSDEDLEIVCLNSVPTAL